MKKNIIISLLLLVSLAVGATLDLNQKHVFPGEEITFTYTAFAPLNRHDIEFSLAGQTRTITVPSLQTGSFSADVRFNAPDFQGSYTVTSSELETKLEVESAIIELKDVSLKPIAINPGEETELSYTVGNIGKLTAYNVRATIDIAGVRDNYNYDSNEAVLFNSMEPGAKLTRISKIKAKQSAGGKDDVKLTVTYEFDGEEHENVRFISLTVGKFPLVEAVIILAIVVIIGKLILSKAGL